MNMYILVIVLPIILVLGFCCYDIYFRKKESNPKENCTNYRKYLQGVDEASDNYIPPEPTPSASIEPIEIMKNHLEQLETNLLEKCPNSFIEYKKLKYRLSHLKGVVTVYNNNEISKDEQRIEIKKSLIKLLYILLGIFYIISICIFIYLFHLQKTNEIITLFKWLLIVTLGEVIGMIVFMVHFLFKNNTEMFKLVKEMINDDKGDKK